MAPFTEMKSERQILGDRQQTQEMISYGCVKHVGVKTPRLRCQVGSLYISFIYKPEYI